MKRYRLISVVFVLIFTLACTIQLFDSPAATPTVVTQAVTSTSTVASPAPLQPTEPFLPPDSPLPTLTLPPLPTAPPIPTATYPGIAQATLIKNANCRAGPSQAYDAITSFYTGTVLEIVGRNPDLDNTWWLVRMPGSQATCWISLVTAQASGNFDDIPIIYPPY